MSVFSHTLIFNDKELFSPDFFPLKLKYCAAFYKKEWNIAMSNKMDEARDYHIK